MPVEEVTRAVEYSLDAASAEDTTLNDGIDSFKEVGSVELEGTSDDDRLDISNRLIILGEVHDGVKSRFVFISDKAECKSFGIRIN